MKTMGETYDGEGSPEMDSHLCCDKCGYCVDCGDCKCKTSIKNRKINSTAKKIKVEFKIKNTLENSK